MMGALLVLLVIFSSSAKQGETAEAIAARQQLEEMLQLEKENLSWRLQQLTGVRQRTADDLSKSRLQLAGVEENARALADELDKIVRTSHALEADIQPLVAGADDLQTLERKLKSSRESLDKTRAELASKPPAYAVVPYAGANGTHRRPLYIECSIDGVFLQPEGIRLSPSDFEGPAGPGNPLASALRAAREHITRSLAAGDPAAQPYPLLLVRPSGVMAYYAAREAIASWGTEFGYQLVDEDWTLIFPQRDAQLAEVETRAVEESRRRLAWLAESRPAKPAKPAKQYRAATTRGGVVAEGGPSVLGDQSRWNWTEEQAGIGDLRGRGINSGDGQSDGTGAGDGSAASGDGHGGGGDVILGSRGAGRPLVGSGESGSSDQGRSGGAGSGEDSGSSAQLEKSFGSRYGGGSKFAGSQASAGSTDIPGQSAGGQAAAKASGSNAQASGASGGDGDQSSASAAAGGGGGSGPAMPGMMSAGTAGGSAASSASDQGASSASASMAGARGKNWASRATSERPIPLTRPIRIECAMNEFRILDDSGHRVVTRIPVAAKTADAIDPLVKAVYGRVDGWGIAGDRMYWKPQLVLADTPDGRSRREELERLLADSGLDTRTKNIGDEIRNLPPINRSLIQGRSTHAPEALGSRGINQ